MSIARGIARGLIFFNQIRQGDDPAVAKRKADETMTELAPLIDPALMALDEAAGKIAARRRVESQAKEAEKRAGDGATVVEVVEATNVEVIDGDAKPKAAKPNPFGKAPKVAKVRPEPSSALTLARRRVR